MARPTLSTVVAGLSGWDATVNTNFEILTEAPLPVVTAADPTALAADFPASSYDYCIAAVIDSTGAGGPPKQFFSDGTAWNIV